MIKFLNLIMTSIDLITFVCYAPVYSILPCVYYGGDILDITFLLALQLLVSFAIYMGTITSNILHPIIFSNWVRYPEFIVGNIRDPERVGLHGTENIYINSPDGCRLGMWHLDSVNNMNFKSDNDDVHVFLYLHGKGCARNQPHRVRLYTTLRQMYPNHQVFALDYRGYGDSTGTPSEDGLVLDSMTAYNHILESFPGKNVHVIIWGQSLGTGVATKLSRQISEDPKLLEHLKCLIIDAPFTDIISAASTFSFLKYITEMLGKEFTERLIIRMLGPDILFDTKNHIQYVKCPIVILHGRADSIIPVDNSVKLYNSLAKEEPDCFKMFKPYVADTSTTNHTMIGKHDKVVSLIVIKEGGHNDLNTFKFTHDCIKNIVNE